MKINNDNITPRDLLEEADLILSQRGQELGDYAELYENFAVRINLMLKNQLKKPIEPWQATKIIAEMKLARMDVGGYTRDHVLDCGNYLFLTGALHENGS